MTLLSCAGSSRPPTPSEPADAPATTTTPQAQSGTYTAPIRAIPTGTVLTPADLIEVTIPRDYLLDDTLAPVAVVGRTATARLLPFEQIRSERLGPVVPAGEPVTLAMSSGGPTLAQRGSAESRSADTVMVITAALNLELGRTIVEEDLYAVQIDPARLPDGVFLSPEHVVGRTTCEPIYANEFVRGERLADTPGGPCVR
ncbi:MAG: SAF domain-containing protein [Myxococcota bacterium]